MTSHRKSAAHTATAETTQASYRIYLRRLDLREAAGMEWKPTQFQGISIKILYEDKDKGEMTYLLKWEPGATLPMHKHPETEQTYVIEGSFHDHDGICRAGEFVWRRVGSFSSNNFRQRCHDTCHLPQAERLPEQ